MEKNLNDLNDLKIDIRRHYKLCGYEKQHYLKELLEKFLDTEFSVDEED